MPNSQQTCPAPTFVTAAESPGSILSIPVRRIVWVLAAVLAALTVLDFVSAYGRHVLGYSQSSLLRSFDSDEKANFPTAFKLVELLGAAALLWMTALAKEQRAHRYVRHWKVLSAIFLFLTLDEEARIHQLIGGITHGHLHTTGVFYCGWVLFYTPAVALFVVAYWRFFLDLPARQRLLFFLAAAAYVGGALGFEFVKGAYASRHGEADLGFALLADTSDTFECIGLLVFAGALCSHLNQLGNVELRFVQVRRRRQWERERVIATAATATAWHRTPPPPPGQPGEVFRFWGDPPTSEVAIARYGVEGPKPLLKE